MMVNRHRGEASIAIGGRTYVVWYGWPGIDLLRAEFGDSFDVAITQAMTRADLPVLGKALAIGLRDAWPGVTGDILAAQSPPIAAVCEAITLGIRRSFHGDEEPVEPAPNPPGRLRRALAKISSWRPTGRHSAPA